MEQLHNLTLIMLSTAPENILPLETIKHVTLPSWRAIVCEHVINSVFHTYEIGKSI